MLISYNWLSSHFDKDIPEPDELASLFNRHAFEVDGIHDRAGDVVFEIAVLPDRAPYALSHKGIAGEVHAMTGIPEKVHKARMIQESHGNAPKVHIEDTSFCTRYMIRRIDGVSGTDQSPKWLQDYFSALEERSINVLVDATNFIMLDVGQPLHVFDAEKVIGDISIRSAKEGEEIELLDGSVVVLSKEDHVIADEKGALAIAGVKGGKRAEVDASTKTILIESAHFNLSRVYQTARRLRIHNNSSKRFSNGMSSTCTELGMSRITDFLFDIYKEAISIGPVSDSYPLPQTVKKFDVSVSKINTILGMEIARTDMVVSLERLGMIVTGDSDTLSLTIPAHRLDLENVHDIADEVGRLHGYDTLEGTVLPSAEKKDDIPDFITLNIVRLLFTQKGFSEIMTSTFAKKGEAKVLRPVAKDKAYLRTSLEAGMTESLLSAVYYSDLLGTHNISLFEVGTVFSGSTAPYIEDVHIAFGIASKNKKSITIEKEKLETLKKHIVEMFTVDISSAILLEKDIQDTKGAFQMYGHIIILDTKQLYKEGSHISTLLIPENIDENITAKPLSDYPYITRDISAWLPEGVSADTALEIIKGVSLTDIKNIYPVDSFEKEGRRSCSFRLVFQSDTETLTDISVNKEMEKALNTLSDKGFELR